MSDAALKEDVVRIGGQRPDSVGEEGYRRVNSARLGIVRH
jgi:hypothetical protein